MSDCSGDRSACCQHVLSLSVRSKAPKSLGGAAGLRVQPALWMIGEANRIVGAGAQILAIDKAWKLQKPIEERVNFRVKKQSKEV